MIKNLALLVIALLLVIPGESQNLIKGSITGLSQEKLIGATVRLIGTELATASDREGTYLLSDVQNGFYTMEVRYVGYSTLTKRIKVDQNLEIDIQLKQSPIISDAVIVKGTRANKKDPIVYSQISEMEINSGNRTQDIPYLLNMTPSMVVTSDAGTGIGYTGLRIRGTDPSRINVTVNGIPYNDSESHDVYWVDIPDFISSVDNIQIQRGIGTSTNGAAAFGANINIQTKSLSAEPYAELHSTLGSFNTLKNTVSAGTGLMNDHFTADFRLSNLSSDGFIDRAFAKMNSVYFAVGWYSKKSILKATVFTGHELTYQAWGGVPAEMLENNRTYNPYTYENEVDDYQQNHFQLHWSYQFSHDLNFNMALHHTSGNGYYEQFKEDQDFADYLINPIVNETDTIFSTDLVRRKWLDNKFSGAVYNLSYSLNNLDVYVGGGWNQYDGDHFGRIIWAQYASNSTPDDDYYFSNGLKTDFNNFIKANYSLGKKINLFADIQYRMIDYTIDGRDDDQRDLSQYHKYNFFNPKGGLVYTPAKNHRLYGSVAVGNREPKRSNFTDARPDQVIKPEQMIDFEGGYGIKSNKLTTSVNLYYMDYKDQLVLTGEINDVGSPIMVNVSDSYRTGIEFEMTWNPANNLLWGVNASISKNKILSFDEYVDDWDTWGQQLVSLEETDLAFSPNLIAASRLEWKPLTGMTMRLDSKYVGEQYLDNTSSQNRMLDAYFLNDFMISYERPFRSIKNVRIFVEVKNLLNHQYESNAWVYSYFYQGARSQMVGYYPQAGRNYLIGLSLSF